MGRHLGKLTKTLDSSAPTKEARRVLAAFLRGEPARAVCHGKGEKRICAIETDGRVLEVGGDILATHRKSRTVVCVPQSAAMKVRRGKRRETEAAKDVRVVATMLLRRIAGVSVRTAPDGDHLLAAKGRAALLVPTACLEVKLSKRQVALLATATTAVDAARAKYNVRFPTQRQITDMRKMLAAEKRMSALFMARQRRGKAAPAQADEYDYTPAPEDRGTPFNVEDLLEPVDPEYDTAPPEMHMETDTSALPRDVPNPTDPEAYARFVNEYLSKLRKGMKRDVALRWQRYLLYPHEERVSQGGYVTPESEKRRKIARTIELEIAAEYGIADPLYGFVAPEDARRGRRMDTPRKRRGPVDPIEQERMRLVREGPGTAYKQRKEQKAQAAREMRYLTQGMRKK